MNKTIADILSVAQVKHVLEREEIMALLASSGADEQKLLQVADQVRREHVGDQIWLRGLVEFSNYCGEHCLYCGLRAANDRLTRYRMTPEEIMTAAERVVSLGLGTIVLQSGEDRWWTCERVAGMVARIKATYPDLAVTLSLGERSRDELRMFREAGADRYLMRFETSNPKLYAAMHPGSTLEQRLQSLGWLRDLGYEVGSGSLVGLPGQTLSDLADDLLLLQQLDVDMAGIGPFIPHPHTPLAAAEGGTAALTLKMMAVARLICPDINMPVTTALATLDELGRENGWQSGANVVMPNATPALQKAQYELYPNKRCLEDDLYHCHGCLQRRIKSIGRVVGVGPGRSRVWEERNHAGYTS